VASIAARDFLRLQSLWLAAPESVLEAHNGMTPRVFGFDLAFLIRSSTYQQRSSLTERSWMVACPADRLERCKGTAILQAAPAVFNLSMPELHQILREPPVSCPRFTPRSSLRLT
jgi:hypothetical protein